MFKQMMINYYESDDRFESKFPSVSVCDVPKKICIQHAFFLLLLLPLMRCCCYELLIENTISSTVQVHISIISSPLLSGPSVHASYMIVRHQFGDAFAQQ